MRTEQTLGISSVRKSPSGRVAIRPRMAGTIPARIVPFPGEEYFVPELCATAHV